MPRIAHSEKVLNGKGRVILYENGDSAGKWFYKEKIEGSKDSYKTKVIDGANTLEEAKERVIEIAFELAKDPVKPSVINSNIDPLDLIAREEKLLRQKERLNRAEQKKNNPKISLEKAFKDWFKQEQKRVDAGALAQSSFDHKFNCCRHIKFYLKHKKVSMSSQINESTFDDYCIFRLKDTDKRILIQRELSVLGEFIKSYLVKYKYIPARLWLDGQFLPKIDVRQTDRDANPAINPEDWGVIINHIRNNWRKEAYET